MAVSLLLAAQALRAGLALRRARRAGLRRGPQSFRAHLRFAKPAVVLVLLGFLGGPLSMAWLRGRQPFDTGHALFGVLSAILFAATALLGRRLEARRGRPLDLHAALGVLALLLAAVAAVMGFVLLP